VVTIAPARPTDAQQIALLLNTIDHFDDGTPNEPLALQIAQINAALFSATPAANALLAWENDRVIGIAIYSRLWPAVGLTQSVYLKELYVAEGSRNEGSVAYVLVRSARS
jgi:hypothetical protein